MPDDARDGSEAALIDLVDVHGCVLVLTTGGTGPAMRDVTPDATRAVCGRELPGLGEAMRAASGGRVPTAMLSRQTAAIRGTSLIVNLPGKPGGCTRVPGRRAAGARALHRAADERTADAGWSPARTRTTSAMRRRARGGI